MTCASSLALTTFEDTPESFKACTSENAHVVSEIFCLPQDYRKDVPPPSKILNKSSIPSILLKVRKQEIDSGTVSVLSFSSSIFSILIYVPVCLSICLSCFTLYIFDPFCLFFLSIFLC